MNMMAINLDWLLTIPGMLISSGVLLLMIALIIFVVTTVKSKKEGNQVQNNTLGEESAQVVSDMAPTPEQAVSQTVEPEQTIASTTISVFPTITDTPIATDVNEGQNVNVVNVIPITPVQEEIEPQSVFPTITDTPIATTQEEVEPQSVFPTIEDTPIASAPIYGGASPAVEPVAEIPRPIYGGADPMEATIKMDPIIEPTPVVPEVNPIVPEATLTDTPEEKVENHNTAVVDDTTTDYVVEPVIPTVETVEAVPVETKEEIEQL